MRFNLIIGVLLASTSFAFSQNEESTSSALKSNSISIGLSGVHYPIGISYSQMVSERLSIEISTSIYSSGAGLTYYLTNPRLHRLIPYTGVSGMINYDGFPMFYLPLGLSYRGNKNFQYSIDIGILYAENVSMLNGNSPVSPWFGLKAGYLFGEDVSQLGDKPKTTSKNTVSINLGGFDVIAGVIYERLLTPYWGIEAGIGFLGASLGSRIYIPAISSGHLNFHIGFSQSWGFNLWTGSTGLKTYFPLGINMLTKGNIRWSLDVGPQIWYEDVNEIVPSFTLRVGKAF